MKNSGAILGYIGLLMLIQVVNAHPLVVAASNAPALDSIEADYFCDGIYDQEEIHAALAKAGGGGIVELTAGTFSTYGTVDIPEGCTLSGQGPGATIIEMDGYSDNPEYSQSAGNPYVNLGAEHATLKGFTVTKYGWVHITASHIQVENVTVENSSLQIRRGHDRIMAEAAFYIYAPGRDIEDIELKCCKAKNFGVFGFKTACRGQFSEPFVFGKNTIRNIRFLECEAIHCGNADHLFSSPQDALPFNWREIWTAGFEIVNSAYIDGCVVYRCRAEDNWESGFHFEARPSTNIYLIECTAINNGLRKGSEWGWYDEENNPFGTFFASGFYIHRGAFVKNCISDSNAHSGFRSVIAENVVFEDCVDNGSRRGFSVQGDIEFKPSKDVTLHNCVSKNATEFGLEIFYAEDIVLDNFQVFNPSGNPVRISGPSKYITLKNCEFSAVKAGLVVESDVLRADTILVRDSVILNNGEGVLQFGIMNAGHGKVNIWNLTVINAKQDCVQCEYLSYPPVSFSLHSIISQLLRRIEEFVIGIFNQFSDRLFSIVYCGN